MELSANRSDVFANIRGWAPPELVDFLDQALVLLPGEVKYRLKEVVDSLPPEGDHLHRVFGLVQSQWENLQSQESVEIALVGPRQTGKTSLVNAISERQIGLSRPIFSVVDIQGLEEYLGYPEDQALPEELRSAAGIVLVLDARFELADSTAHLYEALQGLNKPILVVLNKIDLAENPRRVLSEAGRRLGARVIGVSAVHPETVGKLLRAVVGAVPKALYPLTRNFPELRRNICSGVITRAAFASAMVGAIPIPLSDLLPITAIQTGMLLKIARAFGFELNRDRACELIPMLAAAVAMREASQRLRSRFPACRQLIAVSVAGSWTFLLGQAATQYFEKFSSFLNGQGPVLQEIQ